MPDQVWARQHVLTTLKRRALAGEGPALLEELQQLAGMGPVDLTVTLGVLVDEGAVVNSPAGWSAAPHVVDGEQAPNGATAAAALVDELEDDGPATPRLPLDARDHPALPPEVIEAAAALMAAGSTPPGAPVDSSPRRVTLSAAIVAVLQPEQIGAMVLAGMADAEAAGAVFELVIEP